MHSPEFPSSTPSKEQMPLEQQITELRQTIEQNADRVAKLGEWPEYIQPGSLMERVPKMDDTNASGFDAGIACALNLIPADKQELSARLHANYSKASVEQVRKEAEAKDPESQTTWWLSACSVCEEGSVDAKKFLQQIERFKTLAADTSAREAAAEKTFTDMISSFELKDGVPFGTKDGCIQGAYIAGYPFGSLYSAEYGIYFIGTYEESLGLEDFAWSDQKDEHGREKSGPVFGSRQFVKCADEAEWKRAVEVVKAKLKHD